jgi:hypothetical protein
MEFLADMDYTTIIWSVIAILEVVFRLTPTQADNSILNKVIWVIEKLIPNKSKDKKISFKLFSKKKKNKIVE